MGFLDNLTGGLRAFGQGLDSVLFGPDTTEQDKQLREMLEAGGASEEDIQHELQPDTLGILPSAGTIGKGLLGGLGIGAGAFGVNRASQALGGPDFFDSAREEPIDIKEMGRRTLPFDQVPETTDPLPSANPSIPSDPNAVITNVPNPEDMMEEDPIQQFDKDAKLTREATGVDPEKGNILESALNQPVQNSNMQVKDIFNNLMTRAGIDPANELRKAQGMQKDMFQALENLKNQEEQGSERLRQLEMKIKNPDVMSTGEKLALGLLVAIPTFAANIRNARQGRTVNPGSGFQAAGKLIGSLEAQERQDAVNVRNEYNAVFDDVRQVNQAIINGAGTIQDKLLQMTEFQLDFPKRAQEYSQKVAEMQSQGAFPKQIKLSESDKENLDAIIMFSRASKQAQALESELDFRSLGGFLQAMDLGGVPVVSDIQNALSDAQMQQYKAMADLLGLKAAVLTQGSRPTDIDAQRAQAGFFSRAGDRPEKIAETARRRREFIMSKVSQLSPEQKLMLDQMLLGPQIEKFIRRDGGKMQNGRIQIPAPGGFQVLTVREYAEMLRKNEGLNIDFDIDPFAGDR